MSSQQPGYPPGVQPSFAAMTSPKPAAYVQMQRLTKVGVLSFGKFMSASMALMGLIVGVAYGAIMILLGVVGAASGQEGGGAMGAMGIAMGLGMMIGIPVFYGVFGFIFGLIYALIINFVLSFIGGLEVEFR
jgi:hypothetical protein